MHLLYFLLPASELAAGHSLYWSSNKESFQGSVDVTFSLFVPYDLQDKSWTHSQVVFFLLSLALVLRPLKTRN